MAAFLILEPRSVFLHVPKTGGASIRHGFFNNRYEGPCQGSVPEEWSDLFKFGFVRNPFDRLISAWQMFAQGMENTVWEHPGQECQDISLGKFLDIAMDESIPYDGVRSTVPRKIRHHALPQTHPFYCIDQADFMGRFERLEDDFQEILDRLGIPRQPLNHMNKTNRVKKTMDYFDPETWQRAVEFYAEDFDRLGYEITEL